MNQLEAFWDTSLIDNLKNIQVAEWMDSLQMVFLIACGFLISRIFYFTGMAQQLVQFFMRKSKGNLRLIILMTMTSMILLSIFISNTIAVMTFIPVMTILDAKLGEAGISQKVRATMIVLAVIYGAHIGGMGSLLGTPSNYYFILQMKIFSVPDREQFDFLSWFAWGIPLVIVLGLSFWIILAFSFRSKANKIAADNIVNLDTKYPKSKKLRAGWIITIIIFAVWTIIYATNPMYNPDTDEQMARPDFIRLIINTSIGFISTLALLIIILFVPFENSDKTKTPIMKIMKSMEGIPVKRIALLVLIVGGLVVVFYFTPAASKIAGIITGIKESKDISPYGLNIIITLCTVFSTEFLNNTPIAVTFFPIVYEVYESFDMHALPGFLSIALGSTSSFMTPIATISNALAFGTLKGVSLKHMILLGVIVNIIAAFILALWSTYVVPGFYDISLFL